jgi:dTDP-4-dehydrorhamnose 3,5-epimerase
MRESESLMAERRDEPGPDHAPEVEHLAIEGVILERFPTVRYEHGALTEVVNASWDDLFAMPIEHLYILNNAGPRARDEWYVHHIVTDRYVLVDGVVDLALFDARDDSSSRGTLVVTTLDPIGGEAPSGVRIPAGVWHSFRCRSPRMMLINAKVPGYNRAEPDKYRLPMPNEHTNFRWSTYQEP